MCTKQCYSFWILNCSLNYCSLKGALQSTMHNIKTSFTNKEINCPQRCLQCCFKLGWCESCLEEKPTRFLLLLFSKFSFHKLWHNWWHFQKLWRWTVSYDFIISEISECLYKFDKFRAVYIWGGIVKPHCFLFIYIRSIVPQLLNTWRS